VAEGPGAKADRSWPDGLLSDRGTRRLARLPAEPFNKATLPVAQLIGAAAALGWIGFEPDEDGTCRSMLPAAAYAPAGSRDAAEVWSFPFALAALLGARLETRPAQPAAQHLTIDGRRVALDEDGRFLLRFHGGEETYRQFTFWKVLQAALLAEASVRHSASWHGGETGVTRASSSRLAEVNVERAASSRLAEANVERAASSRLAEARFERAAPSRVLSSLQLTAGIALVLLAAGIELLPATLAVGSRGGLLAAPALRELLPGGAFTARSGLPAAVSLRALLAFGFFGSETLIPLGLSTERGVPPSLVGLSLTAGALAWVAGSWVQDRAEAAVAGSVPLRAVRVVAGLLLIASAIGGVAEAIVNPTLPVELVVVAWAVAGLGMGLAYPASTLTALGMAADGQEGTAAASLQVAETVGIATGTGAAGALFALAVHLDHPISDGLSWGLLLCLASILFAVGPAVRLAPSFAWTTRWRPKPSS